MTTPYQDLNLDQLRFLTRRDADNADDTRDQAGVLRDMAGAVQEKVDIVGEIAVIMFGESAARYTAGTGRPSPGPGTAAWRGESSTMMDTELFRLFETFSAAPDVLSRNAAILDDLADQVETTDTQVDRIQRRAGAGDTQALLESDLAEARDVVATANSGYLSTAEAMSEPPLYRGLREAGPPETSGPDDTAHPGAPTTPSIPNTEATTAGPAMPVLDPAPPGCPVTPTLQSPGGGPIPPSPPAPVTGLPATVPSGGTALPPVTALPFGRPNPTPVPGSSTNPGPRPGSRPTPTIRTGTPAPPTHVRPSSGPDTGHRSRTTPPVIGRRTGGPATVGRPAPPRTDPDGLTRPVIGSRAAGHGRYDDARPNRSGTEPGGDRTSVGSPRTGRTRLPGNSPSHGAVPGPSRTTGTRTTGPTGRPRAGQSSRSGRQRTDSSESPPGTRVPGGTTRRGARGVTGAVIGRRASELPRARRGRAPDSDPRAGQRAPKPVHGDSEAVNRAVIRGARRPGTTPPAGMEVYVRIAREPVNRSTPPPLRSDNPWFDDTGTVAPVIRGRRGHQPDVPPGTTQHRATDDGATP